ncbi:hypothetical protein RUM43_002641 [Polyplax serrata]|uniref:C2H2-type domain-containing protein n=1 Tax=Polyplax serrata TaxID=468196 RepID=A0AAN8P2G9_POLSC
MNNVSFVSVYENVSSNEEVFSKSNVYRTINDLLSVNGDVEVVVFCPLCVNTFEYKFSLFEHLRTVHYGFLIKVKDRHYSFKECPFCNAKFYGEHLTAKHSLLYHSKVIRHLFVNSESKCSFCGVRFKNKDYSTTVGHIEKMHFMEFEEEFRKKFSSTTSEMTFSEFINITVGDQNARLDSCLPDSSDTEKSSSSINILKSGAKDFVESSKINCFDFTELKQQLQTIKDSENKKIYKTRSIMKNVTNSPFQKSVRRVLRFDIPDDLSEANKENSMVTQKLSFIKDCYSNKNSFLNADDGITTNVEQNSDSNSLTIWQDFPKHSSTPIAANKNFGTECMRDVNQVQLKCNTCPKNNLEFEFKCGKCKQLFKENLDLVCHVKNNHKKFNMKILNPSYRCAICNARFFKNRFLKKHHRLHRPY